MRSAWANVAERVYEADVTQGVSRYNTDRIGPEDPEGTTTTPPKTPEKFEEDEEDHRTGWKPLSLSTPMLAAVIALTLLIAAAIETLAQRSKSRGGLALSNSAHDIPRYAELGYLYLPTLVAVLYSMVWSWIDLDAKRMQPWFELSKPRGATATNSIFLDYQYDFVGFVPFRAAKKKHWPVFFSGTAMIVVLWILTPLQSSLLGTSAIAQASSVDITTRSQLTSMSNQVSLLGPDFLNTGYAIAWLDQPYPSFTTSKYALLPYYLDDNSPASESNWTATTTKFSTELKCWPAKYEMNGPRSKVSFNFLNGQGCNVTVAFDTTPKDRLIYMGYYSSAYSSYSLAGPYCPKTENSTHQFLAIWSRGYKVDGEASPSFNITALFCQPTYYSQKVRATVDSKSYVPSGIEEVEPRQLLSDVDFNSTAFEYVLANGMAERPIVRDYPFNQVVEQQPRINDTGISRPITNMVGFALAGDDLPSAAYSNADRLHNVFNRAHQYLFAIAIQNLLTNGSSTSNLSDAEGTASVEFYLYGVLVSRLFASILEGFLCLVVIFTAFLIWCCRTAPSKLSMNPTSLSRHIDLFRHSPELLRSFRSMDTADEDSLKKEFEKDHVKMVCSDGHQYTSFQIARDNQSNREEELNKEGSYEPVRPLALKRETGALLVISLIAAIASLSYLKKQEQIMIGLPRPSNNFEVLQLLENYVPTIFATLIEPFWILLNRLLCVLQPFRDLWQGQAKASNTIDALYTSIPPQLVFFRALKSRHFMLMLLCIVALLANLLAIGLGSLFNELPTTASYIEVSQPVFAPRFDNTSIYNLDMTLSSTLITTGLYQDPMYVMLANYSTGTTLPPWVSHDYFFQEHGLSGLSKGYGEKTTYTLQTRGFGVNANCTPTTWSELPIQNTTLPTAQCLTVAQAASIGMRNPVEFRPQGRAAFEYLQVLNSDKDRRHCDDRAFLTGWGRTDNGTNVNATIQTSLLACRPIFETAIFNLTIDSRGHVLSYNRTTKLEPTLDYPEAKDHINELFFQVNLDWGVTGYWHNHTLTQDWITHLLTLEMNSREILNPDAAVPDPSEMAPLFKRLYSLYYAIFLSLNLQLFDHDEPGAPIQISRHTPETRIFMENASFIITIAVLSLNIVTALAFYARSTNFVLPRMPTTLGSVVAYTASSRFANRSHKKALGERTYSFGWFTGVDGKKHLGIEMDPHVTRVDPASLVQTPGVFRRLQSRWFSSRGTTANTGQHDNER